MADPISLRCGPSTQADGSVAQARGGKTGELGVSQVHGKYYEGAGRGNVYSACTAATGAAPSGSIGTTGSFTLSNPIGSAKRLILHRVMSAYLSGTYAAGPELLVANNNPTAAAPTGTAITPVNRDVGAANNSVAKPLTTSTLPATPSILIPLWTLPAFAGAAAPAFSNEVDIEGEVVIEPGCSVSIESITGAGTSPLSIYGMSWEEVPI